MSTVHEAFCRATAQVEKEMGELLVDEGGWEEEYVTIRLTRLLQPQIRYARFNKRQEGRVGGDYILWWVDRSGECFGCLLQAKNINRQGRSWHIGFQHPGGTGKQMRRLFETADLFKIPAGFVLYAGERIYRSQMRCESAHRNRVPCYERDGAAVTLVPALVAEREMRLAEAAPWHPDRSAVEVFCQWAKPLIEVTAPGTYGASDLYRSLDLGDADHGLRDFLSTDQVGARRVARHIFDIVGKRCLAGDAPPEIAELVDGVVLVEL
ncbi:hypothetical protein AB0G95_33390 [Streptomyces virginiae]|uniref:hypothetical protein n=1 Tax=Streptomyces virginiae TaxID=1961 RepID=UPI0034372622